MFLPQENDDVVLLFDAKLNRRVNGKVVKVRGKFILVEFRLWSSKKLIRSWFPRLSDDCFGAHVKEKSIVGDEWYSVYPTNADLS